MFSGQDAATDRPRIAELGRRILLSEHFVLYLTALYFLVLLPFIPHLASPRNLANVLSNTWPLLAVAVGQTVVLITAGIDLSQTAIMAMVSVAGGMIMATQLDPLLFEKSPLWDVILSPEGGILAGSAWALPAALVAMLFVGAGIGLLNGLAVARFRMPPFMVTLVGLIASARNAGTDPTADLAQSVASSISSPASSTASPVSSAASSTASSASSAALCSSSSPQAATLPISSRARAAALHRLTMRDGPFEIKRDR